MKINKTVKILFTSCMAVALFSVGITTVNAQAVRCNALRGVTQGVPSPAAEGRVPNIDDSGRLDFERLSQSNNAQNQSYAACVQETPEQNSPISNISSYPIRGWSWNENLGFVSFACKGTNTDADPQLDHWENNGASCAPDNDPDATGYGTYIAYDEGEATDAPLVGFAWGDNIGWISMSCMNDRNMGIECGDRNAQTPPVNYAVRVALVDDVVSVQGCAGIGPNGTLKRGDLYGYAWTDTVGWMNMCGARATFGGFNVKITPDTSCNICDYSDRANPRLVRVPVCPPEQTVELPAGYICPPNGDDPPACLTAGNCQRVGGPVPNNICNNLVQFDRVGETVYADGDDAYNLRLNLTHNGRAVTPVAAGGNYNVSITPAFTNQVRANQIDGAPSGNGAAPPASLTWNQATSSYTATVTSFAPAGTAPDILRLDSVSVQVSDNNNAPLLNVNCPLNNVPAASFSFQKPVDVTQIATDGVPNKLFAITDVPQVITVNVKNKRWNANGTTGINNRNNVQVHAQVYDCSDQHEVDFESPATVSTAVPGDANFDANICQNIGQTQPYLAKSTFSRMSQINGNGEDYTFEPVIRATRAANQNAQAVVNPNALGMRTSVTIERPGMQAANWTRYYTTAPAGQVSDSSVITQAASIVGDVRVDVLEKRAATSDFRISETIGEKSKSRRETFARTIEEVLGRPQPNSQGPSANTVASANPLLIRENDLTNAPNGILYRVRDPQPNGTPCKVIFDRSINIASQRTLVTKGCDIYIDNNILADRVAQPAGELGIVALQDFSLQGTRKGGNIYICSTVTDVRAHLVADGSVFSYGGDPSQNENACNDAAKQNGIDQNNGRPIQNFGGGDPRVIFRNQLTILGTLVSQNTFGGSIQAQPILGDGTRVQLNQSSIARLYDLNFLRFVHTRPPERVTVWDFSQDPPTETNYDRICWSNAAGDGMKLSKLLETFRAPPAQNQPIISFSPQNQQAPYYTPHQQVPYTPPTDLEICGATEATVNEPGRNRPDLHGVVNILFKAPSDNLPVFNKVR